MTRPYKLLKSESVRDILKMPDKTPTQTQFILSLIQNSKKELTTPYIYKKTPTILPRRVREILATLNMNKKITRRKCDCGCAYLYSVRKN